MSSLPLSRIPLLVLFAFVAVALGGADGCSSDPNIEGAKLNITNQEYDSALENLDEAIAANPENVEAYVLKSEVLRLKAEQSAASAERASLLSDMRMTLDRASEIAPDDPSVADARLNAWAFAVNQGNDSFQSADSDPADAVTYFRAASEIMPDSSQGFFGLGLAEMRAANFEAAIDPLTRSVELSPDDVTSHEYLARAYLGTDQATEAVRVLEAAQERFPDNGDIRTTRLNAYAIAGMSDRALEEYERELAEGRDDAIIRYNYGSLLLQNRRIDEAIEQLEKAVEMDPSNSNAQYNLGAALQNKASELAGRANETDDNDEANTLLEQREAFLVRALPYLEAARDLAEGADESSACNALFQVYTQLNRIDDANGVAECAGMSMN